MNFTREQAIAMALDAGLPLQFIDSLSEQNAERITRLCTLAADSALEAAAKVCDTTPPKPFCPSIQAAHAIRTMKDHQ
jgi:hypothetical protein